MGLMFYPFIYPMSLIGAVKPFTFKLIIDKYVFIAYFFIYKRFYLFIFREGKGERKRGRETSMCGCPLRVPYWGPGPKS